MYVILRSVMAMNIVCTRKYPDNHLRACYVVAFDSEYNKSKECDD